MIPIEDFTYADYLTLEAAYVHKDFITVRRMIGRELDALTILAELEARFEGSGGDSGVWL